MKKIIPILIIIFLIPCFLIVKADYDGESGDANFGDTCPFPTSESGVNYCAYTSNGIGMRVTLLTSKGEQKGVSNNIIINDYYSAYSAATKSGTGCSRVQYLNGKSNCNSKTTNANDVASLFSAFNINLETLIRNKDFDQIWNWSEKYKFSVTDAQLKNLYTTLFNINTSTYNDLVENQIDDLWIVIEPLAIITKKTIDINWVPTKLCKPFMMQTPEGCFTKQIIQHKTNYAGTTYELGKISNIGDAITVVKRTLPCQLYLTGTIAENNETAPGVNLSNHSYFYGKLIFAANNGLSASNSGQSIEKVCEPGSKDILKDEYITGNYGAGVGLVYFKDTVKSELTCDIVNQGMGTYLQTFNQKLDNAYKTGGINAIYNLSEVKNGIKFTGGVADKYWYINECTCYGAYTAYQPNINKPQLYDQPKKIIENLFKPIPNIFTNYFDTINNKLVSVDVINKGTTVSWDYNKYENLECAHLDCREVDFEKIDFSKLDNPKMTPEECNETYGGKFPVLYNQQKLKQCIKEYNEYNDKLYGENGIKKQCERLPLYGDQNYTEEYVKQYIDQYKECFELYNEQFGTNWTYDSYTNPKDDCPLTGDGGETPKKYNCTPKYNVGTCLDGESVFYSDSAEKLSTDEYWENCVFDDKNAYYDIDIHKVSDKNSSLTYYDKTLSSSYCEVYCTETLTTGFNSNTMNVISGQYFVWNNHSLSGSRTCKTKSIDWDKFKKDLSAAKDQNQANAIYNEMKKCYDPDIWDENIYNLNPTGILTYYYTVNGVQGIYNVNQEMDKNITYTTISNNLDCKDTTVKVGNTNQTIKQCTSVEMTKGATVQFSLPSGLYQYINKDNNISFNANQLESLKSEYLSQGKQLNYLNVGYSNLPVEFKVPEGYYGQLFGNGELSITYSDLGHKVGNNKTAVDTILGVIDSYNYGNWQCDFIVEDGLIPGDPDDPDNPDNQKGPGGIDLIYRPIDLYDPFPDIDGSGRNTGSNWCNYNTNETDCSNDNQVVYDYILNNRDVEGEEIYSKDPMYTFILTPSIIREIRNYNNQNSYTDYSGSLGDKTYDFKCNEGTGETCISDYLSHIIDITGAKNQPGTCVDDKFRTYNDSDNFEGCRYFDSDLPIFNPPSYELPVKKPDISTH